MTLLINHSFESTNYSNNNDSSLLVSNDRDYTMDRKVLQFNRLSKALKELESNLSELKCKKKKRNKHKKRVLASKLHNNNNTNKNQSLKMDNCHKTENSIKIENNSYTQMSSTKLQQKNNNNYNESNFKMNSLSEVDRLEKELFTLKRDNTKLHATTKSLKQEVEQLNRNYINKNQPEKSNESFEKIDNTFIEMNKILADLSQTKLLLQKTRDFTSTKEETNMKRTKSQVSFEETPPSKHELGPTIQFSTSSSQHPLKRASSLNRNDSNIRTESCIVINQNQPNNNSNQTKRFHTNLRVNPLIDLNYKLDKSPKTSLYPIELKIKHECDDGSNVTYKTNIEDEFESIKRNLEQAQNENLDLKRKISDFQKSSIEKSKQSELWKTMYDRLLNCLPDNKANLVRTSTQIETTRLFESSNNTVDDLNFEIKKLNSDNLNLKIQLEDLKQENQNELDRINAYRQENEKLKSELSKLLSESESNSKHIFEMNNLIETYKTKLKSEENQNEELKKRHEIELNAAKIRYENELEKQNKLMNIKYDNMISESSHLNLLVHSLEQEKKDLLSLIQREVKLRKEINQHKEAINRRISETSIKRHSVCNTESSTQILRSFTNCKCDLNQNSFKLKKIENSTQAGKEILNKYLLTTGFYVYN